MHTMRRLAGAAALLLALALLTIPSLAAAQNRFVSPVKVGDKIYRFGEDRSCLGVTASNAWLMQVRVGQMSLNMRLHNPDGDTLTFQENLERLDRDTDEIRLSVRVRGSEDGVTLQLDQGAADVLARLKILEIVVVDERYVVLACYSLADIQALRDALSLREGELLCLSGEDEPVTVVSEDGVRRMIAL